MSELKDLSWVVQEAVEPAPFEEIMRRGRRRRRRRQTLAGIGVVAATTAVVLASSLPFGERLKPDGAPAGPLPASVISSAPTAAAADRAATVLIGSKSARLVEFLPAEPHDWAATWMDCVPGPCRYATKLTRDGMSATTPVRTQKGAVLQAGDETVALVGPGAIPLTAGDPTWAQSLLVRLTDQGKDQRTLRYAAPTSTFAPDEILTTVGGGNTLGVLNLQDATLRALQLPADLTGELGGVSSPVRDDTGRWWISAGPGGSGSRSYIAWTDDGGRDWQRHLIDDDNPGSKITVSRDGRTVLGVSWMDGATFEAIGTMVMSTDAGATWKTVQGHPWAREGGPVAFNNGTAVMLGREREGIVAAYGITAAGRATRVIGFPAITDLAGDELMLYGSTAGRPDGTRSVSTSTDGGRTWTTLEPR